MAEFSDSLGLQDFQNYCRLCFEPGSKLENLLTSPVERNLGEKIVDCVNVSILPEDSPATLVCQRCLALVEQFYDFKEMCKKHEFTFQTSIRLRSTEPADIAIETVHIKTELPDEDVGEEPVELIPLEFTSENIKQDCEQGSESESENQDEHGESEDEDESQSAGKSKTGKRIYRKAETKLLVRLIHNGFLMNCKAIKLTGVMQWICRNSACRMSFTATVDWKITLHTAKVHNHYPFVNRTGTIQREDSGVFDRYSISSCTGKTVLIWNNYEWLVGETKKGYRKAVCKDTKRKCHNYIIIKGDFESVQEFGQHNHPESYILYRDDDNPDENELNPWDLFVQINPCGLPIGTDWDMNRRVKLFHNRFQYRLMDCTWNGTSRWACDMINCKVNVLMDSDENVSSEEHNHEPLPCGIFNRFFFSVVRANTKCLKLCFNGHCYGSRDSNHWVCTTSGCYVKLYVGSDYQSFAEKGHHKHDGFSVVVKPIKKKAVFLTTENPFLPDSITIDDLHKPRPSTSKSIQPKLGPPLMTPENAPKTRKLRETVNGSIRMIYDGYRYSLWNFFPDGTTYWCCWGIRCKKSIHMTSQGLIYAKNESQEHQHPPQVTKVDQITHENGEKEWYAIFKDLQHNTILVYRNTLWDLVLGEQCYVATCQRCETNIKITENFTKFAQSSECRNHDEKMILIRVASKPIEGDPIIWEIYKRNFPLQLSDGTIFTKGRHSQLFIDGFRYTLVSFTWTGGELWRCAIQRCPARGKIAEPRGDFNTPVHTHEPHVMMQGKIWSEARQREEWYFVVISLKKTIATLYYNTYCYALKDRQRNIWSCFPGPCQAVVRIEGDFERVVEEMEHSHDGTLTFIRTDKTYDSQECYGPATGTSKKRPREESSSSAAAYVDPLSLLNVTIDAPSTESSDRPEEDPNEYAMDVDSFYQVNIKEEPSSSSPDNTSPKLQEIINALLQPVSNPNQTPQPEPVVHYHDGYTYNRATALSDGRIRLDCNKIRCPGRVIIGNDHIGRIKDGHTHTKAYESGGSICDYDGQCYQYIVLNDAQRGIPINFVCDGFRYNFHTRSPNAEVVWQCDYCSVKATVNASYTYIQFDGSHTHERYDILVPTDENPESKSSNVAGPSNFFFIEEVIWDQHRYNKPLYIRRLNVSKWRCFRTRECKAHLYQNAEGTLKEMESHDHEGPIEASGEARFDPTMKLKDRYAVMKSYGKSQVRHLVFQNQIYIERNPSVWNCANKLCNAQLSVYDNFDFIQAVGTHTHQPTMAIVMFRSEVQKHVGPAEMALDAV